MEVILGECGFCSGVQRAITIAEDAAKRKGGSVYTNTGLIHNKQVIESLESNDVFALKEGQTLKAGDIVIISAHGAGEKVIEDYARKGVEVIDAACAYVKKIHNKVKQYSLEKPDGCVIIIGDKNHAEVRGTAGWCERFQTIKSADEIDYDSSDDFLVVVQTTFPHSEYSKIRQNITETATNRLKRVEFFDSICYTTLRRQEECETIAKQADTVLVIGDKNSSNCSKLVELASCFCKDVRLIQNEFELNSIQINKNTAKLGILSGASTPKELTMEVFNRMSEMNKDTLVEEVTTTVPEAQENTTAEKAAAKAEPTTMDELMSKSKFQPKQLKEGRRVNAEVISADATGINVAIMDLTGKNDCGFIPKEEAELDGSYDPANYKAGDVLEAIKTGQDKNKNILSKRKSDEQKVADEEVKKILAGEEFTMSGFQVVKGGLLGKLGSYTVFVPASQIRMGYVSNLEEYAGKKLRLKALPAKEEVDEEGNVKSGRSAKRIVASQRIILEAEKIARDEEFWSRIYEGAIVNGKVKRFTDFGAFVSLKYMDALVHNSDLSWTKKRINPADVLEINKAYDFVVLAADRENNKISLGYKQLQKRPIEIAQEKYPVGSIVNGKVVRVVSFGAFVELEEGIDGLVHVSQIKHGWIQSASEALKEGDEVTVEVMSYDNDKITLSIKELLPVEEAPAAIEEEEKEEKPAKSSRKSSEDKPKTRRTRKDRDEEDDEPKEYTSSNSTVTLGDLFNLKK
ncbi:MAG TPA: 4-hydroxy-3-methylbut-2-enyl diphosphate reductase [Clostridia bacterium]|nr:4-hydroxy-3-methylbut-2-enyl diphosphate reductase [Clostridia bacterium]